jgi:uncharacterized BrkB/YihY/UPF0761 family membrane protein
MYRTIATVVYLLVLFFHVVFIHIAVAAVLPQDISLWWGIPLSILFALAYAVFIAITLGICYYHILPEKSKKYWED